MQLPHEFGLEAIPLRTKDPWLTEPVPMTRVGRRRICLLLKKEMNVPVHAQDDLGAGKVGGVETEQVPNAPFEEERGTLL